MTKAMAIKPQNSETAKPLVDPAQRARQPDENNKPIGRTRDAPGSRDESYDGGDENDDVINRLVGDRGKLEEDNTLNEGSSAYSDHPSNGPAPKDWPATE